MSTILIVDDEPGVRFALSELLADKAYRVVTAVDGNDAMTKLDDVDVVITDLAMPKMSGLELLAAITSRDASIPVILLTAHGSERVAVAAIKAGAYDYLAKPFDIDEVVLVIARALETRRLRLDNRRLSAERAIGRRIVATSRGMRRVLAAAERIATRDVTVLVRGETGTGKEFVAQLLHAHSPRAAGPLVRFNCAAIPEDLAEAELFGHARGAFTGAGNARRGFFAEANGGTLILDEVGELPMGVQAKLLRAIQEGEIQPVGSGRVEKVDVRVVASTNRDLLAEVRAGRFREDLYYRLNVVELVVPPLRDRREDIAPLAEEFARRYSDKFELGSLLLDPALITLLTNTDWPGNVRQLENTVARLAALSSSEFVSLADHLELLNGDDASHGKTPSSDSASLPALRDDGDVDDASAYDSYPVSGPSLREQVEAFERGLIARVLDSCANNQSEAARRLGVSRVTLIDKLKKYSLGSRRT